MPEFKRSSVLELEVTSKCTLSCPQCPRVKQVKDRDFWDNGGIDADVLLNAIDDVVKQVYFGGSYGDAIYHPDIIRIMQGLKDKKITFSLDTNGSYVKEQTWNEMADLLDLQDIVTFSVDGPPDNFTDYRVNGDWPTIERGIRALTSKGKSVRWKYIVFKYNSSYQDIKAAYDKARELGVKQFMLVHTKRAQPGQHIEIEDFSENLDKLEEYADSLFALGEGKKPPKLRIQIHPRVRKVNEKQINQKHIKNLPEKTISDNRRIFIKDSNKQYNNIIQTETQNYQTQHVYPQCMNVNNWPQFIGSDGIFYPCCYTRTEKRVLEQAGFTQQDFDSMSVYNHTIDEIVTGPGYQKLMANFDNLSVCKTKCPAKSK